MKDLILFDEDSMPQNPWKSLLTHDIPGRPYDKGVLPEQLCITDSIKVQHDILEQRLHHLQDTLSSTKAEIKVNQDHTKYFLQESIDMENDLASFMDKSIMELTSECSAIIQSQLNKFTEDFVMGTTDIFSIANKMKNENVQKELFALGMWSNLTLINVCKIAKRHSEGTFDIAQSVTSRMASSAVMLPDQSAKSAQLPLAANRWQKMRRGEKMSRDYQTMRFRGVNDLIPLPNTLQGTS